MDVFNKIMPIIYYNSLLLFFTLDITQQLALDISQHLKLEIVQQLTLETSRTITLKG